MAMEEADIPKTAFRAGSSSLYEFTCMPFGLTNAGASFCCLMEMCIGDQQYVTLLFYLDDICVFAESADQMLDHIELVFSRLQEYHLKIKLKKSYFFQTSVTFYQPKVYHLIPKKSQKSKTGLHQKLLKRYTPLWAWPRTIAGSFLALPNGRSYYTC